MMNDGYVKLYNFTNSTYFKQYEHGLSAPVKDTIYKMYTKNI